MPDKTAKLAPPAYGIRAVAEPSHAAMLQAHSLLEALCDVVLAASRAIRRHSSGSVAIQHKEDGSPVSAADAAAEAILIDGLRRIMPGTCVVSEEAGTTGAPFDPRSVFALVDPLDGTREFLAGRDEFTVNLAIIAGRSPVIGILAAPACGRLWRGVVGRGAERLDFDDETAGPAAPVAVRRWSAKHPLALVSRSHPDAASAAFLAGIPGITQEAFGSALKFCRLAEGGADLYARLSPTCEWDIAAGDALLTAAGGLMTDASGHPIRYGDSGRLYRVPGFIALADPAALPVLPRRC